MAFRIISPQNVLDRLAQSFEIVTLVPFFELGLDIDLDLFDDFAHWRRSGGFLIKEDGDSTIKVTGTGRIFIIGVDHMDEVRKVAIEVIRFFNGLNLLLKDFDPDFKFMYTGTMSIGGGLDVNEIIWDNARARADGQHSARCVYTLSNGRCSFLIRSSGKIEFEGEYSGDFRTLHVALTDLASLRGMTRLLVPLASIR